LFDVKEDIRLVIRFTSHWILYGALGLTGFAVLVSAIEGVTR
jgi:hypothetical protein